MAHAGISTSSANKTVMHMGVPMLVMIEQAPVCSVQVCLTASPGQQCH